VGDAGPGLGEPCHLGVVEVDAVGEPDVVGDPAEVVQHRERALPEPREAVGLLLDGSRRGGCGAAGRGAVPAPPTRSSARADAERAAGRDGDHDPFAVVPADTTRSVEARIASRSSTTWSGGSPPSDAPRSIDPRARCSRGADLERGLGGRVEHRVVAVRDEVVVVGRGGAARQQQLGEADPGGGVDVLDLELAPTPGRAR
jgi:hypothetical protein